MTIVLGIPTLNRFDLLSACIDSALAVGMRPDLILVIDNSGGACPRRPDCMYATPEMNIGVARSWNLIADTAWSMDPRTHLIISNDDLEFASNTLEWILTVAESQPKAGIVSALEGARFSLFWLRRACWQDVGRFDPTFYPAYFEDNDYHYRMGLASWESPIAPSAVRHAGSQTLAKFNQAQIEAHHAAFRRNQEYFIKKWGGGPGHEVYRVPFNGGAP